MTQKFTAEEVREWVAIAEGQAKLYAGMKDKLRELAAEWLRKGEFSKNSGAPRCGGQMIEDATELLAVLDAEGDGGAVDTGNLVDDPLYLALDALYERGWNDSEKHKHDARGTNEWQRVLDLFRATYHTRSGVVSDEEKGKLISAFTHPPAQAAQFDRARETPRRQQAVEMLLNLGWAYNVERGWEEPAQVAQGEVVFTGLHIDGSPRYERATHPHSPDAADSGRVADASAEDRFEQYVKTLIDHAPDVQKLGERLAHLLDDDQFNNIEPTLLGIAAALAAQGQGEAVYQVRSQSIQAGWSEWADITKEHFDSLNAAIARGACSQTRVLYAAPPASPVGVPDGYDVGWKIRGVTAYNRAKARGFKHPECVEAAIKAAPSAPEGDGGGK